MSARINKLQRSHCWSCESSLAGLAPLFFPVHEQYRYGHLIVTAPQVCPTCFNGMEAEAEAEVNSWRFCAVDFKDACLCGRPSVVALAQKGITCVPCWREKKMLNAAQRSINQTKRLVALLRRESAHV